MRQTVPQFDHPYLGSAFLRADQIVVVVREKVLTASFSLTDSLRFLTVNLSYCAHLVEKLVQSRVEKLVI